MLRNNPSTSNKLQEPEVQLKELEKTETKGRSDSSKESKKSKKK